MRDLPTGTVTFLFSDVEGSTRLLQQLGAEEYSHVLADHRALLRKAFALHGGVEVDSQGDAFFVAFSRAGDAIAAAVDAQRRIEGDSIRVRIGVHTGEPIVTEEGYVGLEVHRAARIAAVGHGGQVLLSEATRALVRDTALRDLGEHRLKDLTGAERIWQLGDGEFPPLRSLNRTNLPVASSPLLGRARELAELIELIRRHRLVTVTGAGGTGKTRLALQAAAESVDDFPDGVFFVALAHLRDPSLVGPTIAQAAGVRELDDVRGSRALLLVDNFEHLLGAAHDLSELLARAPELQVLVTSRAPLRLGGEHEYVLEPLREDEAVAFFVDRARAAGRDVPPDETVRDIARQLDNLPLALELAAARVRLLEPAALRDRLGRRLPLLTGGARDAPERQRTLRSTIEWSHELLDPIAQRLFARLAVFAGGFELGAAEEVCDAAVDELATLVELSLVKSSTGGRFLMLETIREYAVETLDESAEAGEFRRRHAEYFMTLAVDAEAGFYGADEGAWLERLGRDYDNVRAAIDFSTTAGEPDLALRAGALRRFWHMRGYWAEGRALLDEVERSAAGIRSAARAKVLMSIAELAWWQGDAVDASARAAESLEIAREIDDAELACEALTLASRIASDAGDEASAQQLAAESVSFGRAARSPWFLARAVNNLGEIHVARNETAEAGRCYGESLALFRRLGHKHGVATAQFNLGLVALYEGREVDALSSLAESIDLARDLGDRETIATCLEALASVEAERGRFEPAARLLGAAEAIREELGTPIQSTERSLYDRTVSSVRSELPSELLAAVWAEGRSLSPDDAWAEARATLD